MNSTTLNTHHEGLARNGDQHPSALGRHAPALGLDLGSRTPTPESSPRQPIGTPPTRQLARPQPPTPPNRDEFEEQFIEYAPQPPDSRGRSTMPNAPRPQMRELAPTPPRPASPVSQPVPQPQRVKALSETNLRDLLDSQSLAPTGTRNRRDSSVATVRGVWDANTQTYRERAPSSGRKDGATSV